MCKVLAKLKEAGLYARPEKCEFSTKKTRFLGFIISKEGIEMDPEKVKAVMEWEVPKSVRDVQCFLGFANFYRRFIQNYSGIYQPLFNLLKKTGKTSPFTWTPECQ